MELYEEILAGIVQNNDTQMILPPMKGDLGKLCESACYRALESIKKILEDDALEDSECFWRIEEIVRVYERLGSDCGNRHDFA